MVRLFAVAGIAAALLAVATSAQSRAFRVRFDPLFNLSFSQTVDQTVGWRGSATIDVADGCLVPGTIQVVDFDSCSASLTGGTLVFYDTVPLNSIGGIIWAGTFDPPTRLSIDAFGDVNGMDFAGPPLTSEDFSAGWENEFDVALDFTLPGDGDPGGPVLTLTCCDFPAFVSGQDGPDYEPVVIWEQLQQIPEPATLALVGAALALLGMLRLRRG